MGWTAAEIEAEVRTSLRSNPPPLPTRIETSRLFREQNNSAEGIRPTHAAAAAATAYAVERFDTGDGKTLALLLGHVDISHAYTMVLLVLESVDKVEVSSAWRLYHAPDDITPAGAFALLLERYGNPVSVGGFEGRFIPSATEPPGGPGVQAATEGEQFEVSAMFRREPNGGTTWSWVYAFDFRRYLADVRRARR